MKIILGIKIKKSEYYLDRLGILLKCELPKLYSDDNVPVEEQIEMWYYDRLVGPNNFHGNPEEEIQLNDFDSNTHYYIGRVVNTDAEYSDPEELLHISEELTEMGFNEIVRVYYV